MIVILTAIANEAEDWTVNVLDGVENVVWSSSGTGPGPIDITWDGKVGGSYVPGIYRLQLSTASSQQLMSASSTTSLWPVAISKRSGSVLITIALRVQMEGDEAAPIVDIWLKDAESVMDQCLASGIPFTIIADPQWETGEASSLIGMGHVQRKGVKDWLRDPFKCWFHAGHGRWMNGRTFLKFYDRRSGKLVCGDDFQQLMILPGQYRLVQLNSCNGAGLDSGNLDTSIAEAFGIDDQSEGACFISWCHAYGDWEYYHGIPYERLNGSGWTRDFWGFFGEEGCTVSAAQSQTLAPPGYWWLTDRMHEYLVTYGDPGWVFIDDLR